MSVSSLPEWKQLLLERKRREEEERERREKEEEKKLASMPAWKRGIIQRRRAKQEGLGDREKEKDRDKENVLLSSCDGDTDLSVTVHLGYEPSLSPDPGQGLDRDTKRQSQVSAETIVPVHRNPFIRTQSGWRKAVEVAYLDRGSEQEAELGKDKEMERDRSRLRGHEGETGRGREKELKMERCWERRDGREHEQNTDRIKGREKNSSMGKELFRDNIMRERESLKDRREEGREEEERDSATPGPCVPGLRTIRADNIIIIEQERKRNEERRGRRKEAERDRRKEDLERRGVTMDLRELLASGGSVTEIRASEVLIIKPPVGSKERSTGGDEEGSGSGRDDQERERERRCMRECGKDSMGRELRTDVSMMRKRDRGAFKEKERPCGQATVITEEDRKGCVEERGVRVSQLLSKFGDNSKLPSRSKSSDHFNSPDKDENANDDQAEERKEDGKIVLLRGVPRRSASFSDRVVCAKENGMVKKGHHERRGVERAHSDRLVSVRGETSDSGGTLKLKLGWSRLSETDSDEYLVKPGRQLEEYFERNETGAHNLNQQRLSVGERVRTVDKKSTEIKDNVRDEGFTVAPVLNTEGISFARRVPIRQDRGVRATEREVKPSSKVEPQGFERWGSGLRRVEGTEDTNPCETMQHNCDVTVSVDSASSPCDRRYRHGSAFTECASLLTTVTQRPGDPHRGTEWSSTGPQELYTNQSLLSQHTEDLISKIERVGETTVYHKGERASRGTYDINKESTLARDVHICGDVHSENLVQDAVLRCQKGLTPTAADPVHLEIQIPRTVFYVAEEKLESGRVSCQSDEGQDRDGGREVERRNSWRIGKPLSRIESLREKIRQREERMTNIERGTEDRKACDGTEITASQRREDRSEDSRTEMRVREWEATSRMRKSVHEVECGQDSPVAQTSTAAFDIIEEVNVLKDSPQLPVPLSLLQAARGEELTSAFSAATSEGISDNVLPPEDEDDPLKYGEEALRQYDSSGRESEEEEEEEELSGEVECVPGVPPLSLSESLSPSPPDPDSLAAMSRIYNLKTVGSRTGLCMRERVVDVPQVQLVKVKPHITHHAQQEACHREDMSGEKTFEQHMKQLYLTEQEVMRPSRDAESTSQNSLPWNRNTKETQLSPTSGTMKDQQKSEKRADSPHLVSSPALKHTQSNQPRTATITPRTHRSQSPDNCLKPVCSSPTPACSPNSPSPTPSPCDSPSPSRCPLFSIRSATGSQVKRGATITITPKKSAAIEPAQSVPLETPMNKTTANHTPSPSIVEAEPVKKRYPTVDEIEVIGGYQNLEKSCLMKNRGNPKRVKVCFDESQLEQVCEYPSETSMLACSPYPFDPEEEEEEKMQEEEEEEQRGVSASRSSRIVTSVTGRVLTVGQYHPLLKKHKV